MNKKMFIKLTVIISVSVNLFLMLLFVIIPRVKAAAGCFPDTNGHWAETFICWMADNGIVGGYPDGTFRPGNAVTRAELSVITKNSYDLAQSDDDDTLACLSCATDQIAKWNGSAWQCSPDIDTDTDTLTTLLCATDQIAKWTGSAWTCQDDNLGFEDMMCQRVESNSEYLDSWYTTIDANCPSGTRAVAGGYEMHNWVSSHQCIPVTNYPLDMDTWRVRWAAPNETECAGHDSSTWVLCCP